MGGVVAGTAVLNATEYRKLHTVTLTVNNRCNLKCPHCYLQYSGHEDLITPEIVDYLFARPTPLHHVAIVGMEPLVTRRSAEVCRGLIDRSKHEGMTVSLITNGLTLPWLGEDALSRLDFLDISLDGGRETYRHYRGANIQRIEDGLSWVSHQGFDRISLLEVLNDRTLHSIDDMMEFATAQAVRHIMFSPYAPTDVEGFNSVSAVTLARCLEALEASNLFMSDARAFLLIDVYHCWFEGISLPEARSIAKDSGIEHKVRFVPDDPTVLGIIRVTYDGLVLSSFEALHTSWYKSHGRVLRSLPSLEDHYARITEDGLLSGWAGQA